MSGSGKNLLERFLSLPIFKRAAAVVGVAIAIAALLKMGCGMKAVVGFIEAGGEDEASSMSVVQLGGSFGDRPEESISAHEIEVAKARKSQLYE